MVTYLDTILATIKGSSLVAQDSASTALRKLCKCNSDLIYELQDKLLEVFKDILVQNTYHKVFIYDTLVEFIENMNETENKINVIHTIMPIIVHQFVNSSVQEGWFVPMFECLTSLVKVGGSDCLKYVEPALERTIKLSGELTKVLNNNPKNKSKERVRLEYELNNNLMRCLDFVGTLIDSTEGQIMLSSLAASIPQMIMDNISTDNIFVRQMIYSVLGDFVIYADPRLLENHIDGVLACLIKDCKILPLSLDPGKTFLSVATNSLYAISEIIAKYPNRINPGPILACILKIYESPKVAPP